MLNISNLATTALTAVENKIPNVSNLVTKNSYNTKISEIENKITDHDHENVTSNKNELNELSKKVEAISAKGLTKDLVNKFGILKGAIFFCRNISKLFSIFCTSCKMHVIF